MDHNVQLDTENVRIGAIIREVRRARGIGPSELAKAVGCSAQLIGAIERGKRRAVSHLRIRIAAHLDIPELGDLTDDVDAAVERIRQAFEYRSDATERVA